MSAIEIRPATVADAAACAAIYAPSVEGSVSFEEVPPEPAEMAGRIEAALASHAWLVAERGGEVIGYSYGSRHRERAAYRWATDVATYVAPGAQGEGLGRRLLEALLEALAGRGYHVACAAISLPNEASVALHRSAGFEQSGLERAIGWKAGAWRDVALFQRRLDRPDADNERKSTRPVSAPRALGNTGDMERRRSSPLFPALLIGIGLGGFLDGIVFHQILQWHHMLTAEGCCPASSVAGLEDNTLADGFFHLAMWVAVLAGTLAAVRAWQRGELAPPWRLHFGGLLLGFGAFNLIEGLIDHHLLGIHHVRDDIGAPLGWDLGFLAVGGVLMIAFGLALLKSGRSS